jgi:hypothetical protein
MIMGIARGILPAGAALIAVAVTAQAQTVTVRGVAFDSLRGAPLGNAFVSIAGSSKTTTTDNRGRFRFDDVAPGTYTFRLQHAVLDSIGFTGLTSHATVTDGRAEVRLGVPSFATLWRVTCGTNRVPKDSGFVYGTVRTATGRDNANGATVELTWLELGVEKKSIRQRFWRGQAQVDERGGYAVCGVPIDVGLRVRARRDSSESGLIDLPGVGARVQRRDLLLGMTTDSAQRGVVAGQLSAVGGAPLANARVIVDGAPEFRSGEDGRFRVPGVPLGTRQVEILALGYMPVVATVDVLPNEPALVTSELRKVTTLDVVRVTAPPAQRRVLEAFAARRRAGFGHVIDSTIIANRGTIASVFEGFPSVQVSRRSPFAFIVLLPGRAGGKCVANLWIDGFQRHGFRDDPASLFEQLDILRPNDIAAIEIYPRSLGAPGEFTSLGSGEDCGSVVVWTKRAFGSK